MDRRDFIKTSCAATVGLAVANITNADTLWSKNDKRLFGKKMKGHFTLMQISSATDTIGNSYLL